MTIIINRSVAGFAAPYGAPETTTLDEGVPHGKLDHANNEEQNFSQRQKFGNQSLVNGSGGMQVQGYDKHTHTVIGNMIIKVMFTV